MQEVTRPEDITCSVRGRPHVAANIVASRVIVASSVIATTVFIGATVVGAFLDVLRQLLANDMARHGIVSADMRPIDDSDTLLRVEGSVSEKKPL